jgi:phosphoglycolate phosphatase-like HAD superfamily hydrolase
MPKFSNALLRFAIAALLVISLGDQTWAENALPSWNDGPAKKSIVDFVDRTTKKGSADYIAPENRIAVFDNDGTLWAEQPIVFQFAFVIDRIKDLAPRHPEWRGKQPFQAVIENDYITIADISDKDLMQLFAATHSGMTTEEFSESVEEWLKTAKHPRFKKPYTQLVYQPMLELLHYLRAYGYKTYIVSGGGVEFMRVFAEKVYGIPPEQVIGSSGVTKFQTIDNTPTLVKKAEIEFVNDGPGKPSSINRIIGRRPVFAFGNSDGDREMLEWASTGTGPRFAGLVHHTDAGREYAYDRASHIGKLDKALDEASAKNWSVVDMKRDWKSIFPQ